MKKVSLAHFGSFDISANRYIDLFEKEDISKIKIFIESSKYYQIEDIFLGVELFKKQEVKKKLEVHIFDYTIVDRLLMKFNFLVNRFTFKVFRPLMFLRLKFQVKKFLSHDNIVWLGENDYDKHNLIHCCIEKLIKQNFVIKNYKETRFTRKYFEKKSLQLSDVLIFPNSYYEDFFERLYGPNIFKDKNLFYSDQDQRSRYHHQLVSNLESKKFSVQDGKLHIAIIVGQVACQACSRSGDRYVIFPSILRLLGKGLIVHLFVKDIIKSRSEPESIKESIYHDLARKNSNLIISFEHMRLGSRIYEDIVRCDLGYLHDDVDHNNMPLFEFQKINMPNRYYEYVVSGLLPMSLKRTTFCYQDLIVEEKGFVLDSLEDINLKSLDKPIAKYVNDFPAVFLKAAKLSKTSEC